LRLLRLQAAPLHPTNLGLIKKHALAKEPLLQHLAEQAPF